MAENVIPPRHNDSQEANYKAEATKKDHLRALPIPLGKFQELSPTEIAVHAGLLQGHSMQLNKWSLAKLTTILLGKLTTILGYYQVS